MFNVRNGASAFQMHPQKILSRGNNPPTHLATKDTRPINFCEQGMQSIMVNGVGNLDHELTNYF